MGIMPDKLLIILSAYALDLIFGDPEFQWHPVRIIGIGIEKLELKLNKGKINRVFSGAILVILVVSLTVGFVYLSLTYAKAINPVLYYCLSIIYIYFALSIKDLAVQVNKVYRVLKANDIQQARKNLALIVGRDTNELNDTEIIRASVETVAESTMDGIVAPLFYAFVGGPVLVWAYKAINTLDSMVGYKNETFIAFGKPAAKLDSIVNFIPSRITCLLISTASLFNLKDSVRSAKWGLRYFFRGPEFNSVSTEAAMAGALRVRLGGENFYNSVSTIKPFIGDNIQTLTIKHIKESTRIAYTSSFLFILVYIFYLVR